jgi:SAM-dependent methyltransferase
VRRTGKEMTGFYDEDLAAAHAAGFGELSLAGGEVVFAELAGSDLRGGSIVDLGCGSGEWAALAASRGFDVTGVDVSAAMLDIARSRGSSARFVNASLWDYGLQGPYVAVTAFGEALNYGTPDLPDARWLAALFGRVARALEPGGVFAFDVIVAGEPMRYRSWIEQEGRLLLVSVVEDSEAASLERSIVVLSAEGDGYRRSDERHIVRVYEREEVARALSDSGLSASISDAYGRHVLGPRRVAVVARKAQPTDPEHGRSGTPD